jgi:hypothetical protein
MKECVECGKYFRNNYDLTRHQSRKTPCSEIKLVDDPIIAQKVPEVSQKVPEVSQKVPEVSQKVPEIAKDQCEYCLQRFSRIANKNRHYNSCKAQDDPVQQLEQDLCIYPETLNCETQCRFCNKVLSRSVKLHNHYEICKESEKYRQQLKEQLTENLKLKEAKSISTIQNVPTTYNNSTINNTINNGTINNTLNINVFGQENLSHVTVERIVSEMRKINKTLDSNEDYTRAGKWVIQFNCIVNENPENKNNRLPDAKSMITDVLTEKGWKTKYTDDAVDETFRVRSDQLVQMKEQIEDHNPKVFRAKTTQRSWNHLEQFKKSGFNHHGPGASNRKLRSAFKVGMIDQDEF